MKFAENWPSKEKLLNMMILYMYIAPHQSNTPTKLGKKITPAALEELYFSYEPSHLHLHCLQNPSFWCMELKGLTLS